MRQGGVQVTRATNAIRKPIRLSRTIEPRRSHRIRRADRCLVAIASLAINVGASCGLLPSDLPAAEKRKSPAIVPPLARRSADKITPPCQSNLQSLGALRATKSFAKTFSDGFQPIVTSSMTEDLAPIKTKPPILASGRHGENLRSRPLFLTIFPSIMLPMFLAVADQTIVATALPVIAADFDDGRAGFLGGGVLSDRQHDCRASLWSPR